MKNIVYVFLDCLMGCTSIMNKEKRKESSFGKNSFGIFFLYSTWTRSISPCTYIHSVMRGIYKERKRYWAYNSLPISFSMVIIMGIITFNSNAQTYRDRDNDGLIEIYNIEQLDSIRYNLTGTCSVGTCNGYELTRSLDFNNVSSYRSGVVNDSLTMGRGWNPIQSFNTNLEGNGHTIDHLFINRSSTNAIGLFGYTQTNSIIRNIGLINVSVSGDDGVGGLVGVNFGIISQCYSTGGVMGYNVGGLVGTNFGIISQSYFTGGVMGTYSTGGLVGWNSQIISQCYATGYVSGVNYAGGLVGVNNTNGNISQSYTTGDVSGTNYVGGLLGWNNNDATVSQVYATGDVSGRDYVGGLVGLNRIGTIQHGSWNRDALQTVNGMVRSNNDKLGIDSTYGSVIETYIRGLTLAALQTPTGTATDSIQELGPGFIYTPGRLPRIYNGFRLTVNGVHFTQRDTTNIIGIGRSSVVENIVQGTDTTRSTISVGGVHFTANVIDTTSGRLKPPFTITNIQNGIKQPQIITFASLSIQTFGQAPFVLSASSSAGLSLVYSASNTLISIDTNTVTINGAGTVRITATQTGNENYESANAVSQILTIHKGVQSIGFGVLQTKTYGDAPFVISASTSSSLPVVFSASNSFVLINNNTVTINGVGTVQIAAYTLENDTVAFASQTQILSIHKGGQGIEFGVLANRTFGQAPFVLSASSSAGLSLVYSASNTLISINTNTVTINGTGTVSITATQTGNENYESANAVSQILTIHKGVQSIGFGVLQTKTYGDAPFVISASTSSGLPVVFSASNSFVLINNNTVTINGVGTVQIAAYTLENDTVAFASQTQILNIQKGVQSIGFGVLQTRIFGQVPFVLTASSSAGLPVLFSAASTLLIIDNNTVTLNGAGTVNIIAYNTGNINYAGTFTSQTLLVSVSETVDTTKRNPTLTFTAIPNLSIGTRYVMTATSNSAAAIVFTSNDERIATVSGNTLTAVSTGTAVITASQEANATYNPATAQQTVTVVSTTTPTIRPLTPIEKGNSAIRIYPNPANDYLTIQYDKTQKVASAKVYDMTGKSYELGIMNYELGLRVDLKTLPKGEYSIILYGEKGEVWKAEKVIKE